MPSKTGQAGPDQPLTKFTRRHLLGALAGITATCALPTRSGANLTSLPPALPPSSAMQAAGLHAAPAAWFSLIKRHPELDPAPHPFAPITLTPEREVQLTLVHQRVNRLIRFRPDGPDRWRLAESEGDCEDYAIRKLHTLCKDYGWPRSALTLAACHIESGLGHAVLLVHSDKGVYALDNRRRRVEPWRHLPYRWIAREDPGAPFGLWRKLKVT
ncbi:transglutaminase-like cysteine peptidase [Pelagibius litoralis]|uniref:Transglutaminase-like cysteine peptidase n=1 Tax=Pelagibius litoralis TaxID=374515 RepID=A0A967EX19_9PROT|nr:transglutaminase-like cysteine peptidase [Pelagibius litoralis]NIA67250.1 transglutaminase-like cysteine peptidase [Pelagibius litoralis]